jgi:fumarylacetoacetase
MNGLDRTNDPQARSWLASANRPDCEFPIQNLPFAIFGWGSERFRAGVAIGDQIVDLARWADRVPTNPEASRAARAAGSTLNALMQLGPSSWQALRHELFAGLSSGSPLESQLRECLVPQRDATYAVPAQIGDYTDFYTSIFHATAIGRQFRPDNPLLPNYKWVPIGYHGRSSSIGISGQTGPRPRGQRLAPGDSIPTVGPTRRLDYE